MGDPGADYQKNIFLKVCVSLGRFDPSAGHEKLPIRRVCDSSNEKREWKLLRPWRHWAPFVRPLTACAKNRHSGKSRCWRFDWMGTVRITSLLAVSMEPGTRRSTGWQAENWPLSAAMTAVKKIELVEEVWGCAVQWARFLLFLHDFQVFCVFGCLNRYLDEIKGLPFLRLDPEQPEASQALADRHEDGGGECEPKIREFVELTFRENGAAWKHTMFRRSVTMFRRSSPGRRKTRKPPAKRAPPSKTSHTHPAHCQHSRRSRCRVTVRDLLVV